MTIFASPTATSRASPRLASVAEIVTVFRAGAKRAASLAQVPITDVGAHHQHRLVELACFERGLRGGQRLHRLAQAHLVGQDAAEPAAPQEQPAEAGLLIPVLLFLNKSLSMSMFHYRSYQIIQPVLLLAYRYLQISLI